MFKSANKPILPQTTDFEALGSAIQDLMRKFMSNRKIGDIR